MILITVKFRAKDKILMIALFSDHLKLLWNEKVNFTTGPQIFDHCSIPAVTRLTFKYFATDGGL